MADDSKDIKKNLTVFLKSEGIAETIADLKKLGKTTSEAEKELEDYVKQMGFVTKSSYVYNKAALDLKQSLGILGGSLGKVMSLIGGGLGIKQGINALGSYESAILNVTAAYTKYGQGAAQLETRMTSLSKTINMTRIDIMELAAQYEKAFIYTSNLDNFEKLLKNIQNVTGANTQKMKEMTNTLSSLSNLYPELQSSIENLTEADKKRIQYSIAGSSLISLSEKKAIMDYLSGSNKMSAADEERKKRAIEYTRIMGDFESLWQDIAITVGTSFMPLLKIIRDFLVEHKTLIMSVTKTAGTLGMVFVAVSTSIGLIVGGLKTAAALMATMKTIGNVFGNGGPGSAPGGKSGGISGILSSLVKRDGSSPASALYVIDANGMLGGLGIGGAGGANGIVPGKPGWNGNTLTGSGGGAYDIAGMEKQVTKGIIDIKKKEYGVFFKNIKSEFGKITSNITNGLKNAFKGLGNIGGDGGRVGRGSLGKAGLAFAGGQIASSLGDLAVDSSRDENGKTTSVAGEIGGTALKVGGRAAQGAAIGSIIPGVGTLIGGVAGGAYGVYEATTKAPEGSFINDAMVGVGDAFAENPLTTSASMAVPGATAGMVGGKMQSRKAEREKQAEYLEKQDEALKAITKVRSNKLLREAMSGYEDNSPDYVKSRDEDIGGKQWLAVDEERRRVMEKNAEQAGAFSSLSERQMSMGIKMGDSGLKEEAKGNLQSYAKSMDQNKSAATMKSRDLNILKEKTKKEIIDQTKKDVTDSFTKSAKLNNIKVDPKKMDAEIEKQTKANLENSTVLKQQDIDIAKQKEIIVEATFSQVKVQEILLQAKEKELGISKSNAESLMSLAVASAEFAASYSGSSGIIGVSEKFNKSMKASLDLQDKIGEQVKQESDYRDTLVKNAREQAEKQGKNADEAEKNVKLSEAYVGSLNKSNDLQKNLYNEVRNTVSAIRGELDLRMRIAQTVAATADAQVSLLNSAIAYKSLQGGGDVSKDIGTAVKAMESDIKAQLAVAQEAQTIIDGLSSKDPNVKSKAVENYKKARENAVNNSGMSEADKKKGLEDINKEFEGYGKGEVGEGELKNKLTQDKANAEAKVNKARTEQTSIALSGYKLNEDSLKLAEQEASLASTRVALAGNLMTGLGASVEMLYKEVDALTKVGDLIKTQKETLDQDHENEMKRINEVLTGEEKENQLKAEKMKYDQLSNELSQKGLDIESKKAEKLKSLRDGWSSFLTSQISGTGRIMKLAVTQDNNVRAMTQYYGGVTSNRSGYGKTDQMTGFVTPDRMSYNENGEVNRGSMQNNGPSYKNDTSSITPGTVNKDLTQVEKIVKEENDRATKGMKEANGGASMLIEGRPVEKGVMINNATKQKGGLKPFSELNNGKGVGTQGENIQNGKTLDDATSMLNNGKGVGTQGENIQNGKTLDDATSMLNSKPSSTSAMLIEGRPVEKGIMINNAKKQKGGLKPFSELNDGSGGANTTEQNVSSKPSSTSANVSLVFNLTVSDLNKSIPLINEQIKKAFASFGKV